VLIAGQAPFSKEKTIKSIKSLFQTILGKKHTDQTSTNPVCIPRNEHSISRKQLSPHALKILYRLNQAGYQAFLVGGCIRDLLLGITPKDFDIATQAHPEQVEKLFTNCRLIGRRFRLAHVYFKQEIIEVATFRSQATTQTHHSAHNEHGMIVRDNVYGTLHDDAFRRDFTINALYYGVENFTVLDFTQGMQDLKKKTVRLIGEPKIRLQEDPVRILRAIRIAAKLKFKIDPKTAAPFKECLPLLSQISSSRIFDEVIKMFKSGQMLACYKLLVKHDAFHILFPETHRLCQKHPQFEKFLIAAFDNTDKRIQAGKSTTPIFLFAVLLWLPLVVLLKTANLEEQSLLSFFHENHKTIFQKQHPHTQIPKFITEGIKEIWLSQFYLENLHPRFIWRTFTHPRFRAAYDFYLLRAEHGLANKEIAKWWTDFQKQNNTTKKEWVDKLNPQTDIHSTITEGIVL
jgi:poly(A) polymerase